MSTSELLRVFVALIDAVVWPLLIAVLVWAFRRPIADILKQLPRKVAQATELRVGNFALAVRTKAIQAGRPELADRLSSLSPMAVRILLKTSPETHCQFINTLGSFDPETDQEEESFFFLPPLEEVLAIQELESKGFIEFDEPLVDFLEFYEKLPMTGVTDIPESEHPVAQKGLPNRHSERISFYTYQMTELGESAINTMIDVIVGQFGPDIEGSPSQ